MKFKKMSDDFSKNALPGIFLGVIAGLKFVVKNFDNYFDDDENAGDNDAK